MGGSAAIAEPRPEALRERQPRAVALYERLGFVLRTPVEVRALVAA